MGKTTITAPPNEESIDDDKTKVPWKIEEKERFIKGLCKGPPYKSKNGKINWKLLQNFIKTKSLKEVKQFAKDLHAVEHGNRYPEFLKKAAIDVWREVAEKTTQPGDNIINVCIPQVLTVAALEPTNSEKTNQSSVKPQQQKDLQVDTTSFSPAETSAVDLPNYSQIYNYLSAITSGREIPDLKIADAAIVLDLLEDLVLTLSKSESLVQREFMHEKYKELREYMDAEPLSSSSEEQTLQRENLKRYSSANPFGISFEVLDFKSFLKPDK